MRTEHIKEGTWVDMVDGHAHWYAVQEDTTDPWDYGSYDLPTAIDMLKRQGHGLIAVINGRDNFCEDEIPYEEAMGMGG